MARAAACLLLCTMALAMVATHAELVAQEAPGRALKTIITVPEHVTLPIKEHGKPILEHGKPIQEHGKPIQEHGKPIKEHGKPIKEHVAMPEHAVKFGRDLKNIVVKPPQEHMKWVDPKNEHKKKKDEHKKKRCTCYRKTEHGYVVCPCGHHDKKVCH